MAGPNANSVHQELINHLLGPILPYYLDPGVSEIMINGHDEIFVDGPRGMERLDVALEDAMALKSLTRVILQFSGKRLTATDLSMEARMPNGARVHIVQDPASRAGMTLAIRQFGSAPPTLDQLMASGSLSPEAAKFLDTQVTQHRNIIISGGTGTGKTTLLGILAKMMDPTERIITIEDVAELNLGLPHVVPLEAQLPDAKGQGGIAIRDLFRATLRMRPDRILVGECRGGEALDMIQAMNSGHAGSISTVHADDPGRAMSRLETLCLMADVEIPIVAVRRQLVEAIDIVVQIQRLGRQRRVIEIAEVVKDDAGTGAYAMTPVFHRDASDPDASLLPPNPTCRIGYDNGTRPDCPARLNGQRGNEAMRQ
jgi:pilus assembly protein CpaF